MKKSVFLCLFLMGLMAISLFFYACDEDDFPRIQERVVVANRGGKSISVINARNNSLIETIDMPDDGEPMYVTFDRRGDKVFVGDRANDRVVAFDAEDFTVVGTAPAGEGVFHMWDSPDDRTLWVVNDVDKTLSVIDQRDLSLIETVEIPFDLVENGGKPHDVIVDPNGRAVYTTVVGFPDKSYVLKFSTDTYEELDRQEVGGDAHLSLTKENRLLYVPCQNADSVFVLRRNNLNILKTIPIPGAHGVGMASNGEYLYVTNLPGGGDMAIYTINVRRNRLVGTPTTVRTDGVPHNLAVNKSGKKLFLTHSGGSAQRFEFLNTRGQNVDNPQPDASLELETNPFGLVYYWRWRGQHDQD